MIYPLSPPPLSREFSNNSCASSLDMSNVQLTEHLFHSFSTYLSSQPGVRPPYAWKKALHKCLLASEDSTPRIFYNHGGAKAWVAYIAVKPSKVHGYGQKAQHRCFAQLDNLAAEIRGDLAKMVSATVTHPQVDTFIKAVEQESLALTVPRKLLRKTPSATDDDASAAPQKRRRKLSTGTTCYS